MTTTEQTLASSMPAEQQQPFKLRQPYAVLALLILIFMLNIADRQILTILAEPIKHELKLTDLQLGLLTGMAFALVYSISSVTIARIADNGDRSRVISICLAIWSMMTMACGLVASFPAMLAARMGVAVGESGSSPASISLLADYFPPNRRGMVNGLMHAGGIFGAAMALLFGGMMSDAYGWRVPLICLGVLGVVLSIITFVILPEPRRCLSTAVDNKQAPGEEQLSLGEALRVIFSQVVFRWLILAGATGGFGMYSIVSWMPPFYQRVFGWSTAATGTMMAIVYIVTGITGALLISKLADRRVEKDPGAHCILPAWAMLVAIPSLILTLLSPTVVLSIAALSLCMFVSNGWQPGVFAMIQTLMESRTRATAVALMGFTVTLAGLGLGPVVAGGLSDVLIPYVGQDSLRYALLPGALAYAVAAGALWAAARSMRQHVKNESNDARGQSHADK